MKKYDTHTKTPNNPLVEQHPVDTLVQIQNVLSFLQDYITQSTEQADTNAKKVQINTGHYSVLKLVNDALDYEIERLEGMDTVRLVQ